MASDTPDPLLARIDALVASNAALIERIDRMCTVIELLMMDATGVPDDEQEPAPDVPRYMDGTPID